MKILIDPEDDILYMSFYIKGLENLFDCKNIRFNYNAFNDIPDAVRHTRTMRLIVKNGVNEKHFVIDTNDSCEVNEILYRWSDIYGSVNANYSKTSPDFQKKLISLCPSFAVRYTSLLDACCCAMRGMMTTKRNKRKYLGCWKRMLKRPVISDYYHQASKENYVFHLSTLWRSDEWNKNDEGVNLRRAQFIRACKRLPQIEFEGGLVTDGNDETAIFADCLSRSYSSADYLQLTKDSSFVFNTPAYWNCHGWKLGEYMALGKAILSTPLSNDLPSPLINGKHIHVVEDISEESLKDNIEFLIKHRNYCNCLEQNILSYWEEYGAPEASLKLLGITK